jgi:hypothetical protein
MVIYRREGRNKECACLMYRELKEKVNRQETHHTKPLLVALDFSGCHNG